MANDKCEILLPIQCRHEGVEVGGSLLYLFYRLPIYLQTNLESQRSQVYFAAWIVFPSGDIEKLQYILAPHWRAIATNQAILFETTAEVSIWD